MEKNVEIENLGHLRTQIKTNRADIEGLEKIDSGHNDVLPVVNDGILSLLQIVIH